jgi:hypothetical protein
LLPSPIKPQLGWVERLGLDLEARLQEGAVERLQVCYLQSLVAEMGLHLSVSPGHDSVVVPGVPFGRDVSFRLDLGSSADNKGIVQDVEIDGTVQLPNPFGVAIDGTKGDLGTCGLHQVVHVETTGAW